MIHLPILLHELELIVFKEKRIDYRNSSKFNKKKLLKINENGFFDKNLDATEIKFTTKSGKYAICKVFSRIPVFFKHEFIDQKNNFRALPGTHSIEVHIQKIISTNLI